MIFNSTNSNNLTSFSMVEDYFLDCRKNLLTNFRHNESLAVFYAKDYHYVDLGV